MDRKVDIIKDTNGKSLVLINDIYFKGKRSVDWDEVKTYLKKYVGSFYKVTDTKDIIYIGSELPDEYTGSKYTYSLKGGNAKAKANASLGIPELIEIAEKRSKKDNAEQKHNKNAAQGWYRYETRFALPVYNEKGEKERYNIFHANLIVRHDLNGKKYLYDILNIRKETSNPHEQME